MIDETNPDHRAYLRMGAACADSAKANEDRLWEAREIMIAGYDARAAEIDAGLKPASE